jgi:hypothetical protein
MPLRGVFSRFAPAMMRLESAVVASLRAVGSAFLEGLVAYGMALHGFPPDWGCENDSAQHPEGPVAPRDRLAKADAKNRRADGAEPRSAISRGRRVA